VPDGSAANVA
jgi:hypothetical protein